ncbi:SulP family inorganic anion transporter [Pseudonocardia eucalypti]|uniref:SulP family inorganic anion transporter n=1 Tax=Pseudonocardia eucalypti TaxID=648755 RepID=A0ABP9PQ20_9PSEU|nr:high affinity sulfate transporter 1 [Pseudonocardia eucalypti]
MDQPERVMLRAPWLAPALRPGWAALRRREWPSVRGDLTAGLTVAAYLVPQVIAYATVAGLPPVTGLWTAMAALVGYALLGTSRLLSIGPESSTAIMTAISVAPLAAGDPARYAALCGALALMVGVVCVLGWALRLGFLADLLSRPVLVGYLAGIALIMISGQLRSITGVPVAGDTFLAEVGSFATGLDRLHLPTFALAAAVLALLLALARLAPRAPGPLIAVLLAAAVTAAFSLREHGIRVVGAVPSGLPVPGLPLVTARDLAALVAPALSVAIVAYSDTVLTGRAFATRGDHRLDADREMLALGAANLAAGLVRGFPASSSGSRTALANDVGGRSQLYSLVALAAIVVVSFAGASVLSALPSAALGALVVYAALRLIDPGELRRFGRLHRSEATLALATTVAVLVLGVLGGVLAAIGLSILDLLRKLSRPHDGILGFVPGLAGMHDIDDYPDARRLPGLVVYRYDAPLSFANADNFRRRALAAVDASPTPARWLILNTEAVVELDITAADALRNLNDELRGRGIVLALARVKQDLRTDLGRTGLLETIGPDRIFPTLPTAVAAFQAEYPPHHLPEGR